MTRCIKINMDSRPRTTLLTEKDYTDAALINREIAIIASLDVKGAFNAAWWLSIFKALKEFNCPKNLINLTKSYFSDRSAFISTNSVQIETIVNRGCPQGSCCGLDYWNIQYNSLLNLNFGTRTKAKHLLMTY